MTYKILKSLPQRRVLVQFDKSGAVWETGRSLALRGGAVDWTVPKVYGVGRSYYRAGLFHAREYKLWKRCLERAYCPRFVDRNKSYQGVEVHPRWHWFALFLQDLPEIPGYEQWKGGGPFQLDKDLLVPGNKTYGPGLVQFIHQKRNNDRGGRVFGPRKKHPPGGVPAFAVSGCGSYLFSNGFGKLPRLYAACRR